MVLKCGFAYGASLVLVVYHKLADFGVRERGRKLYLSLVVLLKSYFYRQIDFVIVFNIVWIH